MESAVSDVPGHEANGFASFGLSESVLQQVLAQGFEAPTPIQTQAIPRLLAGKDVLGLAATGTGKTAAFALPILEMLQNTPKGTQPRALVVVPTRELALQVAGAFKALAPRGLCKVLAVYGGTPIGPQAYALGKGIDVVVATPGRALDQKRRGALVLDQIGFLVLDEADEMLDMGFQEDLEALLEDLPPERQSALFSATFPKRLEKAAQTWMHDPEHVAIERAAPAPDAEPNVRFDVHIVHPRDRVEALCRVLDREQPQGVLVFCRSRGEVEDTAEAVLASGRRAEALHGGLSQAQRERVLARLREGRADVVIATDVAARGLDISTLSHVINLGLPDADEGFVHRVGRVGRAGREGVVISLLTSRDKHRLRHLEQLLKRTLVVRPLPTERDVRVARTHRLVEALDLRADQAASMAPLTAQLLQTRAPEVLINALLQMISEQTGPLDLDDADEPVPGSAEQTQWVRIRMDVGTRAGLRPRDLAKLLSHRADLDDTQIGDMKLAERWAAVHVPSEDADRVLEVLRAIRIGGRPVRAQAGNSRL